MKRLIALAMALLLIAGCSRTPECERAVASFLDKLTEGDVAGAGRLTVSGSLGLDKKADALYRPLFGSIQYSIGGSAESGDEARVSVTVTILDLEAMMGDASAKTMRSLLSGEEGGDDIFYTLLQEKLNAADAPTVTVSATAYLVREGGRWKLDLSAGGSFPDAITGNVGEIISG